MLSVHYLTVNIDRFFLFKFHYLFAPIRPLAARALILYCQFISWLKKRLLMNYTKLIVPILAAFSYPAFAQADNPARITAELEERVIEWRRDIHQHPELSNREFRTSSIVEKHLQELGIEVHSGIAHTGVVGILHGDRPGPV